jgi:hypothetical protein
MRRTCILTIVFVFTLGLFLHDTFNAPGPARADEANIVVAQAQNQPPPPPPQQNTSGGAGANAKNAKKKAAKVKTIGSTNIPPGAGAVTKGQKGPCICSNNSAGTPVCTGDCSGH